MFLSLGPLQDKYWFAEEAAVIAEELRLPIYATPGTAEALHGLRIPCDTPSKSTTGRTAQCGRSRKAGSIS